VKEEVSVEEQEAFNKEAEKPKDDEGGVHANAKEDETSAEPAAGSTVDSEIQKSAEPKIKTKKERSEEIKKEIYDLQDQRLRLVAEFDNERKRLKKDRAETSEQAQFSLLIKILDIYEILQDLLKQDQEKKDLEVVLQKMKQIHEQLQGIVKGESLETIESVGKVFDPNLHEAVMQMQDPEKAEGIILFEAQKGYKLHDKIIRHARVVVSKGSD